MLGGHGWNAAAENRAGSRAVPQLRSSRAAFGAPRGPA